MNWIPNNDIGFQVRCIFENKQSGLIRAYTPPAKRSLYFDNGRFVFAHSNVKKEKIGILFVKYHILDSERELEQLLKIKGNMRLGEFLMNQGVVAPDELQRILDEQMRYIFSEAFYHSTYFEWVERDQPIYRDLELPIELPRVLEETILNDPNPERYMEKIPPPDYWIVLSNKSVFERHRMQSEDNLISSTLTHSHQVKELFEQIKLPPKEIARRLYLSLLFGTILARPPDMVQGAAKNLYSLSNPELNQLPPDWTVFAEKIPHLQPHEAFAVSPDASLSQINKRYKELCDWLHPIYYNPELTPEQKKALKDLIDRITEYYERLRTKALAQDVSTKEPHLHVITPKPKSTKQILQDIRTEIDRGQYTRAAQLLKENGPKIQTDSEYFILSGLVLSQNRETWVQAENAFKRALEMSPNNIDYLLELAAFYNHIGLKIKSFHILRQILTLDPNHFRARELLKLYQKQGEPL